MKNRWTIVSFSLVALVLASAAMAQEPGPRILYLTKSQGFEHSVVAQKDDKPSWSGRVLEKLAAENGATITCSKDASLISADNLKNYDMVVFYTQGDLLQTSKDGGAPMGENGVADLLAWIKAGGRYMGFHSASDTFHGPDGGPVTPYLEMVGAEFRGHGAQFEGTIKVVDPAHPTMANIPATWPVRDEWYLFKNFNTATMHVLALVDPGEERQKQEMYNLPAYPVIWCSEYGAGRVFFTALAHREDLWMKEAFQTMIVDAATWLMDEGPANAEPNYDKVVPKE